MIAEPTMIRLMIWCIFILLPIGIILIVLRLAKGDENNG